MASPFSNIIILVDGTESALKAAGQAIELARATQVPITALSVVDTATLRKLMTAHILVEQEVSEFESELERSHQRHLDEVGRMGEQAGVTINRVMQKGVAHSVVLAEQKASKADLIVMGGFRSTITKHDLIARERQLILDEAPCTIMVVK